MVGRPERIMSWIQTYTGRQFFPFDPRGEDVDIRDIAHSLSFLCRFNGHCRVFYSVAEHSLRVSRLLGDDLALWGLLHDAAEAYLSDLPRPVKASLPAFVDMEARLLREIARVFGLTWPMPAEVRWADDVLLATEARDLMEPAPASWELDEQPLEGAIVPLAPEEAERAFLERFAALVPG
jgi:hypothetical protein